MRKVACIFLLSLAYSAFPLPALGADNAAPSATQPAPQINSLENTVIRRSPSNAATQPGSGAPAVRPNTGLDVKRVCYSLAIVIALILALRWGGRLLFPGAKAFRPSRAVQVLSRNIISPKQQVIVLQVGRRVVVVGESGGQMNSLCEITEPDEVASLIGQIRENDRDPMAKTFSSLFGRAGASYAPTQQSAKTELGEDDPDAEHSGPGDRVEVGLEDPALASTRQELNGLMDKVRLVARQFNRS